MKNILTIVLLAGATSFAMSQESFTIYLVRHAEKDLSGEYTSDPDLTSCGYERARSIALYLDEVDINAVHSTDFVRTLETAGPTARSKKLKIELYEPGNLGEIAKTLLKREQNALVVGHSNTTGVLAEMLVGEDTGYAFINEDQYDRIYKVIISSESKELELIRSDFECE